MPATSTFYPRVFALVVAAALGYALILIFKPFMGATTWAAFLAFLLFPLNVRWRRHLRGKGTAAEKIAALREANIAIAATPAELGKTVAKFVS